MAYEARSGSKAVLMGLPDALGAELTKILDQQKVAVLAYPCAGLGQFPSLAEQDHIDLVFCAAEPQVYLPLLQALKQDKLNVPVVVVSQVPEYAHWIEALEAGATDYCAPPFEAAPFGWMIETALRARVASA